MELATENHADKQHDQEYQRLLAAIDPIIGKMNESCMKDGVIDKDMLLSHLTTHAAIHVAEIGLLKEQVKALRHNFYELRIALHKIQTKG